MLFSRDHHQSRAVPAGGGAATHYPVFTWKHNYVYDAAGDGDLRPSGKRRKLAASSWEDGRSWSLNAVPGGRTCVTSHHRALNCDSTGVGEEVDVSVLSRDEIERCSPSRKDGIDKYTETRLRYSYCAYLQSLGMRLDLYAVSMFLAFATPSFLLLWKFSRSSCSFDFQASDDCWYSHGSLSPLLSSSIACF